VDIHNVCSGYEGSDAPVAAGTLYDETVSIDSAIVVANNGACFGSILQVQFLQPITNTAQQDLLINATCADVNNITLLDSFGALDFIGYIGNSACEEPLNCYADVTYDLFVENIGNDFNLTDFDFKFQDATTDLLIGVPEASFILALVRITRPLRLARLSAGPTPCTTPTCQ
jgi:hypothetical protein